MSEGAKKYMQSEVTSKSGLERLVRNLDHVVERLEILTKFEVGRGGRQCCEAVGNCSQ